MPPYTPVVSKAQSRALFAKANRGELSMADARGKTRAADFKSLPDHKTPKKIFPRRTSGGGRVRGAKRPKGRPRGPR